MKKCSFFLFWRQQVTSKMSIFVNIKLHYHFIRAKLHTYVYTGLFTLMYSDWSGLDLVNSIILNIY